MSHSYNQFVEELVRLLDVASCAPLGGLPPAPAPRLPDNAPRALVFAPHPDDECLIGALPLRLRRELSFRVTAVAVTQGSRIDRQTERLEEMRGACHFLGFELIPARLNGLTGITPRTREQHPDAWEDAVTALAQVIGYHRAAVIFMPHGQDLNSTHLGTHQLVQDALATLGPRFRCKVVETEYWHPMADPNLMVGSSPEDVADLVAAASFHRGEVARNPYHLSLPLWMADNVRRGSERVGGQGGIAPGFHFATLYRLKEWANGGWVSCLNASRVIPAVAGVEQLAALFK